MSIVLISYHFIQVVHVRKHSRLKTNGELLHVLFDWWENYRIDEVDYMNIQFLFSQVGWSTYKDSSSTMALFAPIKEYLLFRLSIKFTAV